ncbi:MAG: hypothetical protein GY869_10340, partial [Planctomycetes bacterium]|nr:hypothetical protein [Planctomycetota bacterium]
MPNSFTYTGFHAAEWNVGSDAVYTFTTADVGTHAIQIVINGDLRDEAYINVYDGGGNCGGAAINQYTNGDGPPAASGNEVEKVQEVCGKRHTCDLGLYDITPAHGNDPASCDVPSDMSWLYDGDEDGDGLVNCDDPDCFGYGYIEEVGHGNNATEVWRDYAYDPAECCQYHPGFASFYDDQENNWISMTNINMENFIADTLMAEFTNNGYLPSGVPIPSEYIFADKKTIYVQKPTAIEFDLVEDWEV